MATFYRVVKTNRPTERDFLSMQALERRFRADTPENRRIYDGVFVYATLDAVRFLIGRFPHMGAFVAVLEVEASEVIRVEQTTPDPDHHTLWASPDVLLATVVEVVPLLKYLPGTQARLAGGRTTMIYQLWDIDSANLVAWFSSEEEALHEVRATYEELGADAALTLALSSRDPSGHREAIAAGRALIALAFSVRT